MKKEDKIRYGVVGVLTLAIVGMFVYASVKSNSQKTKIPEGMSGFSIDNGLKEFKVLGYDNAVEKMNAKENKQMFYIGCRFCPHCINLEKEITTFLNSNKDKNSDKDLVYEIEAGYKCVPKQSHKDYEGYKKVYQFLADNKVVQQDPNYSFGTPQFIYVENGRVIDTLDSFGRDADGIKKMFEKYQYRGF